MCDDPKMCSHQSEMCSDRLDFVQWSNCNINAEWKVSSTCKLKYQFPTSTCKLKYQFPTQGTQPRYPTSIETADRSLFYVEFT